MLLYTIPRNGIDAATHPCSDGRLEVAAAARLDLRAHCVRLLFVLVLVLVLVCVCVHARRIHARQRVHVCV